MITLSSSYAITSLSSYREHYYLTLLAKFSLIALHTDTLAVLDNDDDDNYDDDEDDKVDNYDDDDYVGDGRDHCNDEGR